MPGTGGTSKLSTSFGDVEKVVPFFPIPSTLASQTWLFSAPPPNPPPPPFPPVSTAPPPPIHFPPFPPIFRVCWVQYGYDAGYIAVHLVWAPLRPACASTCDPGVSHLQVCATWLITCEKLLIDKQALFGAVPTARHFAMLCRFPSSSLLGQIGERVAKSKPRRRPKCFRQQHNHFVGACGLILRHIQSAMCSPQDGHHSSLLKIVTPTIAFGESTTCMHGIIGMAMHIWT